MYDSHTHLNDPKLFSKWQYYLKQYIDNGGKGLINIGAGTEFNINAINIAKEYNQNPIDKIFFIKATVAYYPFDIISGDIKKENLNEKIIDLQKLYIDNSKFIVGIGECGIDLHYDDLKNKLDLQKELFAKQLDLAQELNLPVIIHSRSAFDETFDIVRNYKNLKIYFHCWGYGLAELKKLQDYFPNFRAGFCGNITYSKAEELKSSLKNIKKESILFETDAPYLAPQKVRGTMNNPANIKYTYDFASKLLNLDLNLLKNQVKNNFLNLYQKKNNILL